MVAVFVIGLIGFALDRLMLVLQRRVSWDKNAMIR
jgi:nitrate/nitrite transport system permease protein